MGGRSTDLSRAHRQRVPNFFTITGPGSPSVLSNMMVAIEQHVDWITDCIVHMREQGTETISPTVQAEDDWVEHVTKVGDTTLFPKANSWYMGANVPGKARMFLPYVGGVGVYRDVCNHVPADGYAASCYRVESLDRTRPVLASSK